MLVEIKNAYSDAPKFLTEVGNSARSPDILKEMELFKYEMRVEVLHDVGRSTKVPRQLVSDRERELGRKISTEEKIELFKSLLEVSARAKLATLTFIGSVEGIVGGVV